MRASSGASALAPSPEGARDRQVELDARAGEAADRPIRVLHVIDSGGLYGAEQVLLELAGEHQRLGHEPVIASIGVPDIGDKPLERAAWARGLPVRPVRMPAGPSLGGALELVRLARREYADVLHTHGYKANILLGMLPRRLRPAPLVATVHGYTDVGGMTRMALYHRVDRLALRRADRVVLVHVGMTAHPGLNRLHDPRWRVIENGIPAAATRVDGGAPLDAEVTRFCERAGVVVGAVGRLSHEKGLDTLLRALGDVLGQRRDVAVVILGEGRERPALERLARELGLADRLLMPGYRERGADYLPLFDLFVLPSLTEGLPLILLEAMRARVPVVATRVGGVPDVLDEGRTGQLVPPGDSAALAAAIRRALDDPDFSAGLAARAVARQASRFASDVMAARYLALYREVMASAAEARAS